MFKYRVIIEEDNLILEDELVSLKYSFDPVEGNLTSGNDILNMEFVVKLLNKEHLKYFLKWVEEKKEKVYRNINLEYIFSDEDKMKISFKDMFIDCFKQKFSMDNELGNFEVILRQKYFVESKRIKLGDE